MIAALDEDFDFDDPNNELEDNFIELAMGEGEILYNKEYSTFNDSHIIIRRSIALFSWCFSRLYQILFTSPGGSGDEEYNDEEDDDSMADDDNSEKAFASDLDSDDDTDSQVNSYINVLGVKRAKKKDNT